MRLELKNVCKEFEGGVLAVKDFNLEVKDKEFIVLTGPSGCGKTVVLKMIAGLEDKSSGEILLDGRNIDETEIKDRDIAMMFQSYLLMPHLSVYDNLAYGLKLRKVSAKEVDERVTRAAAAMNITQFLPLKPKELTLFQQRLIALCRAAVRMPKIFLLDEPLADLDNKSRIQMRAEIIKLYNKLDSVFIYSSQDAVDAMTMGGKVIVMKDGHIAQADTAQMLYDNPDNMFAASFFGLPQMNFFKTVLKKENGKVSAYFNNAKIEIPVYRARKILNENYFNKELFMGVRAEDIHDEQVFIENSLHSVFYAEIELLERLGNETILYLKIEGKDDYVLARVDSRNKYSAGTRIKLAINTKYIHLFDPILEESILKIPDFTQINAQLFKRGGKTILKTANSESILPTEIRNKINIGEGIFDAIVKFRSDLKFDKETAEKETGEDFFEVNGTVVFSEKYSKFTAVYFKTGDKITAVKLPLGSAASYGDDISLFIKFSDIEIVY